MDFSYFKNKKITVYGLGLHGGGVAVVKFLAKHGARVIVTDLKTRGQLAPSLEKLKGLKNVEFILGQHRREDFLAVDLVVKNPAINWQDKNVRLALENKIPVEVDSSLFFKLCKNPIIGVTGTKGKTTTATLIHDILKSAGKNVIKVGISQISVLDQLEHLKKDTWVVFELSSWRLAALGKHKLAPQIGVFVNFLPDHLNYYKDMAEYFLDKSYVYKYQTAKNIFVYNPEIVELKKELPQIAASKLKFALAPWEKGRGVFLEDGKIYLRTEHDVLRLAEVSQIKLPGQHNLNNVLAATTVAWAAGVTPEQLKTILPKLHGTEHRLEFVRELNQVKYYNDTAATIPDAAMAALNAFDKPIILIAGGTDKNLQFAELAQKIATVPRKTILLSGTATIKLLGELEKIGAADKIDSVVDSMEAALSRAQELAVAGEVVLFSPGAASFGLFLNEFDRGEKFRAAVKNLK